MRRVEIILAISVGALLTWLFFWPLCRGGGLIGGDLYPYYFPQKVFLSESLKAGVVPLWNPFVGFGYPVLGESQTGLFYVPNLVLYSLLSPNSAYNVGQLAHYVLAFCATWGLSRQLGISSRGACLTATVFVFGWFPPRICLEWAIIGGSWFALILWAATVYLQRESRWALVLVSLFVGFDLLAGHYNLAFITVLALIGVWLLVKPLTAGDSGEPSPRSRIKAGVVLGMAVVCGFLLAAPQLMPTWELKSLSQRQQVNDAFSPTYGHLPPAAISQLWMPWRWYAGERPMDPLLAQASVFSVPTATNQAEAQLYIGLLPLVLIVLGLAIPPVRHQIHLANPWGWLAMAAVALIFATGWPTYWLSDVPGFGFFRGPGRYSIVAVLSLAVMAGAALDALVRRWEWSTSTACVVTTGVIAITVADLWGASRQYDFGTSPYFGRQVFYATLVDDPPIAHLSESSLRAYFSDKPEARLYAPGPNVPSLLGVSALPTYLGLGPEIYESGDIRIDFSETRPDEISASSERLRRFGVTHLLLESRINPELWPVEPLGDVVDPFINRAFARREPYYFYALKDAQGRAYFSSASKHARVVSFESEPNRVRIEVEANGGDELVLADLWYPGWQLSQDSVEEEEYDGLFRAVRIPENETGPVHHTFEWTYQPPSLRWGIYLALLGVVGTFLLARYPIVRR